MKNIFGSLFDEFASYNTVGSFQQITPNGWELLEEVGIGDEFTIVDQWSLYKVAKVLGSDCYVFARTADGLISDFGWSRTPDRFQTLFFAE